MPSTKNPPLSPPAEVELQFADIIRESSLPGEQSRRQAIHDIFGPGPNPNRRYVSNLDQVKTYVDFLRGLGLSLVYTAGVWDLLHIGHCRYLDLAKRHGDVLIVGTELDEAVRLRKGPKRPVVPFKERVEMLCNLRCIDLIVPVTDYDKRGLSGMGLLELIRPDVFVASSRSFPEAADTEEWLEKARALSGQVTILESQADTSTSTKIRDLLISMSDASTKAIDEAKLAAAKALESSLDQAKARIEEALRKS